MAVHQAVLLVVIGRFVVERLGSKSIRHACYANFHIIIIIQVRNPHVLQSPVTIVFINLFIMIVGVRPYSAIQCYFFNCAANRFYNIADLFRVAAIGNKIVNKVPIDIIIVTCLMSL